MPSVLPASNENSVCLDAKRKIFEAQSDLVNLAPTYSSCYPELSEGERRQSLEEQINSYKSEKKRLFENEMGVFQGLLNALRISNRTQGPVEAYVTDLKREQTALEQENYRLQQNIRAGRRRFLDDDPQGGVRVGKTTDDRVMLFFWITYTLFLIVGMVILFGFYGARFGLETNKQKITYGAVVFMILFGLAYFAIMRYA